MAIVNSDNDDNEIDNHNNNNIINNGNNDKDNETCERNLINDEKRHAIVTFIKDNDSDENMNIYDNSRNSSFT